MALNLRRLALLLTLLPLCARAAKPDPAEDFFTPDKLHTLHLTLTREAWDLMQPTRRPRPIAHSQPEPGPGRRRLD